MFLAGMHDLGRHPAHVEEAMTGNLPMGLLDGLIAPIWSYQYQDPTPGPIVDGLLLTPVFAWAGSSMVAIKALGGLFAFAGVWLWVAWIRRAAGFAASVAFALWMLAPPPLFDRYLHMAWSNHMESIAQAAILYGLWNRLCVRGVRRGPAALLGALAGFFLYYSLQAAVPIAALLLLWIWRDREGLVRALPAALPAFLVGLAPLGLDQLATHRSLALAAPIAPGSPFPEKLVRLFTDVLPEMAGFASPPRSAAFVVLAGAALVVLAASARRTPAPVTDGETPSDRPWLERYVGLFAALFVAAYAVTGFHMESPDERRWYVLRYLAPLYPVLMAAVVLAATRLGGRWGALVVAPFIVWSLADVSPVPPVVAAARAATQGRFARELRCLRGDNADVLLTRVMPRYWRDAFREGLRGDAESLGAWRRSIEPLPIRWHDPAYESLGRLLSEDGLIEMLHRSDLTPSHRAAVTRGWAERFSPNLETAPAWTLPALVSERLNADPLFDADARAAFWEGAFTGLMPGLIERIQAEGGDAITPPLVLDGEDAPRALGFAGAVGRAAHLAWRPLGEFLPVLQTLFGDRAPEFYQRARAANADSRAVWAMAEYHCLFFGMNDDEREILSEGLRRHGVQTVEDDGLLRLVVDGER